MNAPSIEQLVAAQRRFFASGQTLDLAFRKQSLLTLKRAIRAHEEAINAALMQDLGKSAAETYMCETGMTLSELSYMISHLGRFAKKRRVLTPLAQFPSSSFTVREPYGVALIMAPWNYPFMLLMEPLIGALAAGNCAIVKPSAYSAATSGLAANFSARSLVKGKAECKLALQRAVGLEENADVPIIACISRLVGHKGMDLVCQGLEGIMATGCQLVVLGQGESQFEDAFRWAQSRWPGRVSAQITYSDNLSRRIYGAAVERIPTAGWLADAVSRLLCAQLTRT